MTELDIPAGLSDEEIAAQELDRRTRGALKGAPDLMHHVRAIALGSPERGETLREWNAPMRITAADAADVVFAQLYDWRSYWQNRLNGHETPLPRSWRHDGEVRGFTSDTGPDLARILTRVQTGWLLDHHDSIINVESATTYQADVVDFLGALRGAFPTSKPIDYTARDTSGEGRTEWTDDPAAVDAEVRLLLVKPYLLPSEAAILVRKSKRMINYYIRDGLTTYPHEGKRYVRLEEVRAWIDYHKAR